MIRRPLPLAALVAATACAQPERPPGGPEDRLPPVVVETVPDTFALVEPGTQEFFFRFSERISERTAAGQLDNAVVISPPLGGVRVRHTRDGIRVRTQEGVAEDRLYRVTLLPVINDMFQNRLRDPFDLVLSSGPEFVPNVVAGMVEDRVTGTGVAEARVEARFVQGADTLVHWNLTDADGVFSLRFVPGAAFELISWQDRNRDGEAGESEPQAAASQGELTGAPDTSFTVLTLIEPDTTAPRLARAEVRDSVTLDLEFDDYLDPALPGALLSGQLILARLTDTTAAAADTLEAAAEPGPDTATVAATEGEAAPEAEEGEAGDSIAADATGIPVADTLTIPPGKDTIGVRFFHSHEFELREREVRDSVAMAEWEARVDSLAALGELPPPGAAPQLDTAQAPPGRFGLSGLRLPEQTLIAALDEAMVRGVPYELGVSGAVNVAQVGQGGGTTVVVWELPPPDTTTADSAQAVADSLAADSAQTADTLPPDTLALPDTLPPDTLALPDTLPPDTLVLPDTVPPDTVPPDTPPPPTAPRAPPRAAPPDEPPSDATPARNPPQAETARRSRPFLLDPRRPPHPRG